jgi:hypothetical protein
MEIRPITRDEQLLIPGEHILYITQDELLTINRALILRALVPDTRDTGVQAKARVLASKLMVYRKVQDNAERLDF